MARKWTYRMQTVIINKILGHYDDSLIKEVFEFADNDSFWNINFTHLDKFETVRIAM